MFIGQFALATALISGALVTAAANAQAVATLQPVGDIGCDYKAVDACSDRDAIVFVHGVYGGDDTFHNTTTNFDWPKMFPRFINAHEIDVFKLNYQTNLIAWAKGANPSFDALAKSVFDALKPLRVARYNSIGFIAHSLGGNVVSTYVHMVKTSLGHPQRSQNAFIITLATPVLGAQIADLASTLKSMLFMNDPLLEALKKGNLYLRMLRDFRDQEEGKERRYVCRPVHLHAAIERKYLGPMLVVDSDSAAQSISNIVKSPIVGFALDHIAIAKPPNAERKGVYGWVLNRVEQEYQRISTWDEPRRGLPPAGRLCDLMNFIPEPP